jgi:hypothetical protein
MYSLQVYLALMLSFLLIFLSPVSSANNNTISTIIPLLRHRWPARIVAFKQLAADFSEATCCNSNSF